MISFENTSEYKDAQELYEYRKALVKLEAKYEMLDLQRKIILDDISLEYRDLTKKSIIECEKLARIDNRYKSHIENIIDIKLKKGLAFAKVESLIYKIKARTTIRIQEMHDNKMNYEFGGSV